MQAGTMGLVGGQSVTHRRETPRERVLAAFGRAWEMETDDANDEAFETALAAAFRAADAYYRARGWLPPQCQRDEGTLPLFGPEK